MEEGVTTFQNNVDDSRYLRTSSASLKPNYPRYIDWKTVNGGDGAGIPLLQPMGAYQRAETELKVPFGDEWKLMMLTYNDGRDLSNGGDKPLQTLPFHTANGTLTGNRWTTGPSTANYTGEQRSGSATGKTPGGYTMFGYRRGLERHQKTSSCAPGNQRGVRDLSRNDSYTGRRPPLLYGRRLPLLTGDKEGLADFCPSLKRSG